MPTLQISFQHELNVSLQIGDIAWVCSVDPSSNIQNGQLEQLGVINDIQGNVLTVDASETTCTPGMFFLFSKPIQVNESGLKGYYADITFKNSSKTYAELFAISSEIVPSSK